MSKVMKLGSGEVDLTRPKRRRYTVDYKLRILKEADASTMPGQIAALLRREGLSANYPDTGGYGMAVIPNSKSIQMAPDLKTSSPGLHPPDVPGSSSFVRHLSTAT